MFFILYFYLTPRVLSYKIIRLGTLFFKRTCNRKRWKSSKWRIQKFAQCLSTKFDAIKLLNIEYLHTNLSYSMMEFFFYLKNLFFCILIRLRYYGNQIEPLRQLSHNNQIALFYSWSSHKVQTAMHSAILLRSKTIILPLSKGILFNLPQIFVLLILSKAREVNKINSISSINEILIHHAQFISDFACPWLHKRLLVFSFFLFKTSDKHGFSHIFGSCNKDIKDILLNFLHFLFKIRFSRR